MEINADLEPSFATGSRIVSKVLAPAIRLWLRSQVESVASLQFHLNGNDRQILSGFIPSVAVTAEHVVYQGLHLGHIHLTATQIRINLGQVLKGKPLRLLNVIPVSGEAILTQADLNASVTAPLLRQALADILKTVLRQANVDSASDLAKLQTDPIELLNPTVLLETNRLTLKAEVKASPNQSWQIALQTGLKLPCQSRLQLSELELRWASGGQAATSLAIQPLEIDLGSEVNLQQLQLEPERITCRGQINVVPGE